MRARQKGPFHSRTRSTPRAAAPSTPTTLRAPAGATGRPSACASGSAASPRNSRRFIERSRARRRSGARCSRRRLPSLRREIALRAPSSSKPTMNFAPSLSAAAADRSARAGAHFPGAAAGRPLMKPHRVRKRRLEQFVVSRGQPSSGCRPDPSARARRARAATSRARSADHQRLERPHRPERHHGDELFVRARRRARPRAVRAPRNRTTDTTRAPRDSAASAACSRAGSSGTCSVAQIWQCGCGLLAPIIAPRFSKICT